MKKILEKIQETINNGSLKTFMNNEGFKILDTLSDNIKEEVAYNIIASITEHDDEILFSNLIKLINSSSYYKPALKNCWLYFLNKNDLKSGLSLLWDEYQRLGKNAQDLVGSAIDELISFITGHSYNKEKLFSNSSPKDALLDLLDFLKEQQVIKTDNEEFNLSILVDAINKLREIFKERHINTLKFVEKIEIVLTNYNF